MQAVRPKSRIFYGSVLFNEARGVFKCPLRHFSGLEDAHSPVRDCQRLDQRLGGSDRGGIAGAEDSGMDWDWEHDYATSPDLPSLSMAFLNLVGKLYSSWQGEG